MDAVREQTSLVNIFAQTMQESFKALNCNVSRSEVEELSIFLVRTMGADLRDYHRPEHSLEVARVKSPVARLAALFHDLIYVQVDPTWRSLSQVIHPFVPDDLSTLNVQASLKRSNEPWLKAICMILGVEKETSLTPSKGLNEFLSAVVMYRKLAFHLEPLQLFRAIACVAATVPFLGVDTEGKNPAQRLVVRMKDAAKVLEFNELSDTFYDESVAECCQIVQTDLASFGSIEFSNYISNTWNVMYESYPPLRNTYYLISEYRKAVFGNISFLETLDSSRLFWNAYAKTGNIDSSLDERSNYNLRVGQIYLKTVGIMLSVLEAIALLTGGDAPYEMFMGAMKKDREHSPVTIGQFLTLLDEFPGDADSRLIYSVLKEGRQSRARFDRRESALGAYLFVELKGSAGVLEAFKKASMLHSGGITPEVFLECIPKPALRSILKALSKTVLTRSDELLSL